MSSMVYNMDCLEAMRKISQLDLFHLDEAQEETEQMQIFDFLEEQ